MTGQYYATARVKVAESFPYIVNLFPLFITGILPTHLAHRKLTSSRWLNSIVRRKWILRATNYCETIETDEELTKQCNKTHANDTLVRRAHSPSSSATADFNSFKAPGCALRQPESISDAPFLRYTTTCITWAHH